MTTQDPEEKIESALGRTEEFLQRKGGVLLTVVLAIVVVIGGWMAYKHLCLAKRGERAAAAMYVAQQNFGQQMWDVALNGDGNNMGFAEVATQFRGTAESNLAKHYAGICALKMGQQDEALSYLADYKPVKGVPAVVVNAENFGLQGDIYVQKGDNVAAVAMFEKAAEAGNDPYTSPMYLKKLGMALEAAGEGARAVETYQRVLDDYPASIEAREVEKFIGAAQQL